MNLNPVIQELMDGAVKVKGGLHFKSIKNEFTYDKQYIGTTAFYRKFSGFSQSHEEMVKSFIQAEFDRKGFNNSGQCRIEYTKWFQSTRGLTTNRVMGDTIIYTLETEARLVKEKN